MTQKHDNFELEIVSNGKQVKACSAKQSCKDGKPGKKMKGNHIQDILCSDLHDDTMFLNQKYYFKGETKKSSAFLPTNIAQDHSSLVPCKSHKNNKEFYSNENLNRKPRYFTSEEKNTLQRLIEPWL